jgi:hypothetical protein
MIQDYHNGRGAGTNDYYFNDRRYTGDGAVACYGLENGGGMGDGAAHGTASGDGSGHGACTSGSYYTEQPCVVAYTDDLRGAAINAAIHEGLIWAETATARTITATHVAMDTNSIATAAAPGCPAYTGTATHMATATEMGTAMATTTGKGPETAR